MIEIETNVMGSRRETERHREKERQREREREGGDTVNTYFLLESEKSSEVRQNLSFGSNPSKRLTAQNIRKPSADLRD